jgi:hypothetical protein
MLLYFVKYGVEQIIVGLLLPLPLLRKQDAVLEGNAADRGNPSRRAFCFLRRGSGRRRPTMICSTPYLTK